MADTIVIELDIETGKASTNIDKVEDGIEGIGKAAKKTSKSTKTLGKTLGNLTKAAGIVTLLVAAFEVLKNTLGSNQKVMDAVNTATTAIQIVFNDLFTFLIDNVGVIADIFASPLQSIKDLGAAIKKYAIDNFKNMIAAIGLAGAAILEFMSGNFAAAQVLAGQAIEAGKKGIEEVGAAYDKVKESVKDGALALVQYTKETINAADAIVKAEKSLVNLENQQTRVREQADRDAERQRQIRDDFTKGIDDRIKANEELGRILEKQQVDELAAVDAQIKALRLRQAIDKENQELANEIFSLETERFAVEAQQEGFRSEQQINSLNLDKEKLELLGFQTQAEFDANAARIANESETQRELSRLAVEAHKEELKLIDETEKAEKIAQQTKLDIAAGAVAALSIFAEEGTDTAKAVAIGQVAIDVARGLTGALAGWSSLGPLGIAGAVASSTAIIATGIKSVQAIVKVKPGTKPSGTVPTASSLSPASATTLPPEFGVQGDTGQNQLADTIAGAINQAPVKAFVVSADMTNAQQFDRNTLDNATL